MGDSTHYGQPLVDCHIRQCWEELAHKVDFAHRRTQVDSFNKSVCAWHVWVCACVYVYMCGGGVGACVGVCMCVCMCACVGVCMCGCVHVWVCPSWY